MCVVLQYDSSLCEVVRFSFALITFHQQEAISFPSFAAVAEAQAPVYGALLQPSQAYCRWGAHRSARPLSLRLAPIHRLHANANASAMRTHLVDQRVLIESHEWNTPLWPEHCGASYWAR